MEEGNLALPKSPFGNGDSRDYALIKRDISKKNKNNSFNIYQVQINICNSFSDCSTFSGAFYASLKIKKKKKKKG